MRKTMIILSSLLLIAALTACSSVAGVLNKNDDNQSAVQDSSPFKANYEGALPPQTQLVIGTLKLENTDVAVDAEQAAELLPLWKAYRSLSGSDSASSLELEALVDQIQETMTPEQVQAIAEMQLTGADMLALAQEQGIEMAQEGRGDLSPEQIETMRAQRSAGATGRGGGAPGMGGRPGGSGGMPGVGHPGGGQAPSADQIATLRAQRGGSGGVGVNPMLFDALIKLLESKAKS